MVKIHILGGPGSGKTTLAQHISATFHIPHYELDQLGRKNGMRDVAYVEDAFAMAVQPGWVTEGIYLIWTDPLLFQADYIVLLEVPWPVAAWRILHRHICKSLHGTNPYPGIDGLKSLFKLLKDTRDYCLNQESSDPSTAEFTRLYLENHGEGAEPPDTERLLARMGKYIDVMFAPTGAFVRRYLEQYKQKVVLVRNKADRERLFELLTRQKSTEDAC